MIVCVVGVVDCGRGSSESFDGMRVDFLGGGCGERFRDVGVKGLFWVWNGGEACGGLCVVEGHCHVM